jgi:3-hydroxyisobutyrate dehydrogenase
MGTVAPASSAALGRDLEAAGARYVEAPVSGSRVPAERGELVAMLAGAPDDLDRVAPLLAPLTSSMVRCGPVPRALELKLAVNTFLITTVAGLAETVRVAEGVGLDLDLLRTVLDAGQMASPISRIKIAKLVAADYDPQAAVTDVLYNARLIQDLAGRTGASVPLLDASAELLEESERLGLGTADMAAVVEALRARDDAQEEAP